LLKNSGFVTGHDFSHAATAASEGGGGFNPRATA